MKTKVITNIDGHINLIEIPTEKYRLVTTVDGNFRNVDNNDVLKNKIIVSVDVQNAREFQMLNPQLFEELLDKNVWTEEYYEREGGLFSARFKMKSEIKEKCRIKGTTIRLDGSFQQDEFIRFMADRTIVITLEVRDKVPFEV